MKKTNSKPQFKFHRQREQALCYPTVEIKAVYQASHRQRYVFAKLIAVRDR